MTLTIVWLVLLVLIEVWLVRWLFANALMPWIDERLQRRDAVQRSVTDQQMQAMRAAQQLSLLAWKARHEMYDLASHESDSGPAQRR